MGASAAQVFTGLQGGRGDNSGGAAVLDQAQDFLPYAMQMQARKEARVVAEATRLREKAKTDAAAWNQFEMDMPDVWAADSTYIEEDLLAGRDAMTKLKMSGEDPLNPYGTAGKAWKKTETGIRKRTSLAKDNESFFTQNKEQIAKDAGGKYDKEYAAKWFQEYVDPKLTPEDRAKKRIDSSPYKLNYNLSSFADDTAPDPSVLGGGKSIGIDRDSHMKLIAESLTTPNGKETYESTKNDGETETAWIARVADLGQNLHPSKPIKEKAVKASSKDGGTETKSQLVPVATYNNTKKGDKGVTNYVTFNQTTANQDKTTVTADDGKTITATRIMGVYPNPNGEGYVMEYKYIIPAANTYDKDVEATATSMISNSPTDGTGYSNYKTVEQLIGEPLENYLGVPLGDLGKKDKKDAAPSKDYDYTKPKKKKK